MDFTWLELSFTKSASKMECFVLKEYLGQKGTKRYILENTANTNTNIPSILYWAKIGCILHKQQSQGPWNSFTISTELKSSFSLVILALSLPVLEKKDWKTYPPANTTISLFGCRLDSVLSVRMTVAAAGVDW